MKWILIISLNIISCIAKTQPELYNYSIIDSSVNVVYAGADNRMVLTGITKTRGLHMRSGQHTIYHHPDSINIFHIRADRPVGKGDTLSIYINDSLILKKAYRFMYLPVPEYSLAGFKDTTATVKAILDNPVLEVILPGCIYKMHMYVQRYEMELITDQKGIPTQFQAKRVYRLPDDELESIKQLQPGDQINFSYFLASCSYCKYPSKLRPMTIGIIK
jgi:hypothetical protein